MQLTLNMVWESALVVFVKTLYMTGSLLVYPIIQSEVQQVVLSFAQSY